MMVRRITLLLGAGSFFLAASALLADGGTLRLSKVSGPYRLTLFTSPTPLRAGPIDVSVIVCDAATGERLPDARVKIRLAPAGQPEDATTRLATTDHATTKFFQMASFDLPRPGPWMVAADVDGPRGPARVATQLEIAPSLPRWIDRVGWIALPLLPIALFAAREYGRSRQRVAVAGHSR